MISRVAEGVRRLHLSWTIALQQPAASCKGRNRKHLLRDDGSDARRAWVSAGHCWGGGLAWSSLL